MALVDDSRIRLVAGLGNPGPEYAGTRHNIGFVVVDHLRARGARIWSEIDEMGRA